MRARDMPCCTDKVMYGMMHSRCLEQFGSVQFPHGYFSRQFA